MPILSITRTLLAVAAAAIGAIPVTGQTADSRTASLSVGQLMFDASGTGKAVTAALRADAELGRRWLVGELGIGYAPIREQFSSSPTLLGMLDAQLQMQLPAWRIRPYVGAGIGTVQYVTQAGGRPPFNEAVSLGLGVRAPVGARLGLRVDARLRYWEASSGPGFVNSSGEVTAGLSRRF